MLSINHLFSNHHSEYFYKETYWTIVEWLKYQPNTIFTWAIVKKYTSVVSAGVVIWSLFLGEINVKDHRTRFIYSINVFGDVVLYFWVIPQIRNRAKFILCIIFHPIKSHYGPTQYYLKPNLQYRRTNKKQDSIDITKIHCAIETDDRLEKLTCVYSMLNKLK